MKQLVWGGLALSLTAGIIMLLRAGPSAGSESEPGRATIVRAARRDIETVVKATGVIQPSVGAEVRVGARISGVVKRLYVQIGDTVGKGQLLAELDERDLLARRDEAAASLSRLETDLGYARTDLERKRILMASGSVSQDELDLAQRAYDVTEQQVRGARANLDFAEAQLEYTRITAPISGVVASVATQEGETVAASFSAPTFLTLLDPSRLEVWAYVDETDIGQIHSRQLAGFTVDTYGDQEFEAQVTAVHPTAEIRDNVVNYVTVLKFPSPRDRILRPEMTTTVRIVLQSRKNVLSIPIGAVRRQDRRAFVWSPRGESIERRWVTTGARDDGYWEIVDGLKEGDEVLLGEVSVKGVPKP